MKKIPAYGYLVLTAAGFSLTANLLASEPESEVSLEGLQMLEQGRHAFMASETEDPFDGLSLVDKDRNGKILARDDVNWAIYTDVLLQQASVEFRDHWQQDQNRHDRFKVSRTDMRNIKNSLSEQFRVVLTKELSKNGGYKMTATTGEHVLTIKPDIVELDLAAPDTRRAAYSRQLTDSSVQMTLQLEIYDSMSGVLLAVIHDRLEDPRQGYLQSTNSNSNKSDAHRMLKQWAAELERKLGEAGNYKFASSHDSVDETLN